MATIAGVDVGAWALPEQPRRRLVRSIGFSQGGTVMIEEFRDPDAFFTISLVKKSLTTIELLYTALEAAQDTTVSCDPDAHIDLGAGAGAAVNAYWMDQEWAPTKDAHNSWNLTLTFKKA